MNWRCNVERMRKHAARSMGRKSTLSIPRVTLERAGSDYMQARVVAVAKRLEQGPRGEITVTRNDADFDHVTIRIETK